MAYSTLATQADTPTAGPDHTYFEAIAANETALLQAVGASISSVSAQTVAFSTTQKVTFGTVDWDSNAGAFTGTANRITIPTSWDGTYEVRGNVNVTGSTGGATSLQLTVRKNNTTEVWECYNATTGIAAVSVSITGAFTLPLVATDYLEVFVINGNINPATIREDLGLHLSAIWLHA